MTIIIALAYLLAALAAVFALILMVALMRAANDELFPTPRLTDYRHDLRDQRVLQADFQRKAAKGFSRPGTGDAA